MVTHDRWFLDRICTHIIAFEGDGSAIYFDGNYSEYMDDKKRRLGNAVDRMKYKKLGM